MSRHGLEVWRFYGDPAPLARDNMCARDGFKCQDFLHWKGHSALLKMLTDLTVNHQPDQFRSGVTEQIYRVSLAVVDYHWSYVQ